MTRMLLSTDKKPRLTIFPTVDFVGPLQECRAMLAEIELPPEVEMMAGRLLSGRRPDVNARTLMTIIHTVRLRCQERYVEEMGQACKAS